MRGAIGVEEAVLSATGLVKRFGGFVAVDGVDLQVRRGTIHALIGPNGAGKTTCFNLLTKFLPLSDGRIHFDGRDITRTGPADVARLGLVRSFQISAVFPTSRCSRTCASRCSASGATVSISGARSRCCAALDEARTADRFRRAAALSGQAGGRPVLWTKTRAGTRDDAGTRPRAHAARRADGRACRRRHRRTAALIRRAAAGRTVLMVEHNLSVVAALSDTITVLARGQVLAEGPYDVVSQNPRVIEAYIGIGHA